MNLRPATAADAAAIARVHVDTWRAAYRGILSDPYLESLDYAARTEEWVKRIGLKSHFTLVAADPAGGQIVAFADGGPERSHDPAFRGELYALYVLPAHQRHGLGRRLTVAIAETFADNHVHTLLAWVAAASGAGKFFERLGAKAFRSKRGPLGDVEVDKVGYGWTDTESLGAR